MSFFLWIERKTGQKVKRTPIVHHELDSWLGSADDLKKELEKLKDIFDKKKSALKNQPEVTPVDKQIVDKTPDKEKEEDKDKKKEKEDLKDPKNVKPQPLNPKIDLKNRKPISNKKEEEEDSEEKG